MSSRDGMPYVTHQMPDTDDMVNMTRVRALFQDSGQSAAEGPDGKWSFTFGGHRFGPLYQTHGAAEVFTPVEELEDLTGGDTLAEADIDFEILDDGRRWASPEQAMAWINKITPND